MPEIINSAVELYSGGQDRGNLSSSFARNSIAWGEDSQEVSANESRYEFKMPKIPLPEVTTLTSDCAYSVLLGAGTDSAGTPIFIHFMQNTGGTQRHIHFSHNQPNGEATATSPDVADGRRFNVVSTGTPDSADLYPGVSTGDTHRIGSGSFFEDAVVFASEVTRSSDSVTGVAIAVGNYTASGGLSGNGGVGDDMDLIFCDLGKDTTTDGRLREWSNAEFVLRSQNELWVTVVDYKAKGDGTDLQGWGLLIKATRSSPGNPWTFGNPEIVFDYDQSFGVNHTHNFGLALTSASNTSQGADKLVGIVTYGDTEGENGAQLRYVDADNTGGLTATYTYAGNTMTVAFAETPTTRWSNLPGWSGTTGSSSWSARRTIHGQRTADGETYDWAARQYVGCCTGNVKNHLIMGADIGLGDGIVYFDVDAYDLDNDNILPRIWQRWGNISQYGKAQGITSAVGMNCFFIRTDDPWDPTYWAGYFSQTNFQSNSNEYLDSIMLGMADENNAVRFSIVAREIGAQSVFPDSSGNVYAGFGGGTTTRDNVTKYGFSAAPIMAKPKQLGAGHTNYKAYWNHSEAGAGADQVNNASLVDFEDTPASLGGRTMGFATDAEIAAISSAIGLPGLGPVIKGERAIGSAGGNDQIMISNNRQTFPLLDNPMSNTHRGQVSLATGFVELIFAHAKDPNTVTPPQISELVMRLGDDEGNSSTLMTEPDNLNYSGSLTTMTGLWTVHRLLFRDSTTLQYINFLLSNNSSNDYQYDDYVMILAVSAYASSSLEYPIGYSGPSNTSAAGSTVVTNGGVALPDEVQTVTGFGSEGTVAYHFMADPHGVDGEWYTRHVAGSLTADHAMCSLVQDANNYIEVGWRNGRDMYIKSRRTGDLSETVQVISMTQHLMRHDDFKISIRYSSSGSEVDIWHNGVNYNRDVTRNPAYSSPTFKCGDQASSKTIPVTAWAVGYNTSVLTDAALEASLETGNAFKIQTTGLPPLSFSGNFGGKNISSQSHVTHLPQI